MRRSYEELLLLPSVERNPRVGTPRLRPCFSLPSQKEVKTHASDGADGNESNDRIHAFPPIQSRGYQQNYNPLHNTELSRLSIQSHMFLPRDKFPEDHSDTLSNLSKRKGRGMRPFFTLFHRAPELRRYHSRRDVNSSPPCPLLKQSIGSLALLRQSLYRRRSTSHRYEAGK